MTTIHREGWRFLAKLTLLLILLIWGAVRLGVDVNVASAVAAVIFIAFLQFFRRPKRKPPYDSQTVLSPADGRVVVLEEVDLPPPLNRCVQISIFMSPLRVHINWVPVSGEVISCEYHPGEYLVAFHPKASERNERTSIIIRTEYGYHVGIRQIAGMVARRIKCYLEAGDWAEQGEELGFIKFGSRVDVLVPIDSQIQVHLDQVVKGARTVLAVLPTPDEPRKEWWQWG